MATTSSNARNVPSLVGWLDEISDADSRPYSEALFTTFGVDLGYFEGAILGRVRRLGAAVTILTDAAVYDPDPIAVSNAGSAYLLGPVSCSGSFHPKVNIFVGPERAMVSIGSGNLTVGGWQRNQETLVIAEGTKQSVPRLIPEVAIWLEKLQMLRLGDPARDALNRIVMALSRLIEHADTIEDGRHLVTSADGPLLDQLPSTKVTELRICAPFHDPTGQTFTALMQRYEPEIVSIAVQPGRTVIEPSVIIDSAAKHNARLIWNDVPGAYVHGKLIEAVDSTGSWMLTGSANLTKPALLLSSEEGGNVEVGVITNNAHSIYPINTQELANSEVPRHSIQIKRKLTQLGGVRVPVILAAWIERDALVIELDIPAPYDIPVEVGESEAIPPDEKAILGVIPCGSRIAKFEIANLKQSSVLRLLFLAAEELVRSPFYFTSNLNEITHRMSASRPGYQNTAEYNWQILFSEDPATAIARLREWDQIVSSVLFRQRSDDLGKQSNPTSQISTENVQLPRTLPQSDTEAWAKYSEAAIERLGPLMAFEASGGSIIPPGLFSPLNVDKKHSIYIDNLNDEDGPDDLDLDKVSESDDLLDANDTLETNYHIESEPRGLNAASPEAKQVRNWVKRTGDRAHNLEAIDRLAYTRLLLMTTFMAAWQEAEPEWFVPLATTLRSLAKEDVPGHLKPQTRLLAAVGIYRLDQVANVNRRVGTGLWYQQTVDELQTILGTPETIDIENLTRLVEQLWTLGKTPFDTIPSIVENILDHLKKTTDENPWPELLRQIERVQPTWSTNIGDRGVLHIKANSGNQAQIAARAMSYIPAELPVGIVVNIIGKNDSDRRFGRADNLFIAEVVAGSKKSWRTYQLSKLVSPESIVGDITVARRFQLEKPPTFELSQQGQEVLYLLDIGD